MKTKFSVWMTLALALSVFSSSRGPCLQAATPARPARVDVILWFDTEDYLLPASDDAAKRLAELLTARGIRATFKVVGEKARVLEQRGRRDVIAALQKHAIGYHTDFHSVHPTPTEYLADCGWLDGIEEFVVREGPGAADVRRIFGVRTLACYGQPGSSWAPQAVAALRHVGVAPSGVPCYVDEGDHVGLNHRPFWYAGALHVYQMGANCTRMELHDPAAVEPGKEAISALVERLGREAEGGLISIYYHPCEWVHRQFWDGVNFSRGANPPREEWKLPPQRTPEETDAAFARFAAYIDHVRTLPGVRFITASDLPARYPDPVRTSGTSAAELGELARRICVGTGGGVDFQVVGGKAYSVADQFELLLRAVSGVIAGHPPKFPLVAKGLFGPDSPPPAGRGEVRVNWAAFRDATVQAGRIVEREGRVPARVFVGTEAVAPLDYLAGLARVYDEWRSQGKLPTAASVSWVPGAALLPARHVAADTPGLFGGWVVHREGFQAPKLFELARLQAWTLKPAVRRD